MASTSSMFAIVISIAALGIVVWAMTQTERSRNVYGHSVPASYSAPVSSR